MLKFRDQPLYERIQQGKVLIGREKMRFSWRGRNNPVRIW